MKQVSTSKIDYLLNFSTKVENTKTQTIQEVKYNQLMKKQFDNALKVGLLSRYSIN